MEGRDVQGGSKAELEKLVERLDGVLRDSADLPPAARSDLEALLSEARLALKEGGPDEEARVSLHTGFIGALERFEESHPDLAYAIARVVDALSGLGI